MTAELTDQRLVESLKSTICPVCGAGKGRMKSLCYKHFMGLDVQTRQSLYNRLGEGYAEAMAAALRFYQKQFMVMPSTAFPS